MIRGRRRPRAVPASVAMMTTDHLTEAQKAAPPAAESFTTAGWGFGMGVTTVRDQPAGAVGAYGWDGASARSGATTRTPTRPMRCHPADVGVAALPPIVRDFFTGAYGGVT